MAFLSVLTKLWAMLDRRRRLVFLTSTLTMLITGVLEMGSMLMIFGYIKGLSGSEEHRAGLISKLLEVVLGHAADNTTYAVLGGALVVGYFGLKNALSTASQFYMNRFLMKLNLEVSAALFDGVLLQPFEILNRRGRSIGRRGIKSIYSVFSTCFSATAQILADMTTLVMVAAVLLVIDPVLTAAAAFAFGGVGSLTYWLMQRTLTRMGGQLEELDSQAADHLGRALDGLADTRLRDARTYFVSQYSTALSRAAVLKRRRIALQRVPRSVNEMVLVMMVVAAVYYLTLGGMSVTQALPTLALFAFAGMRMTGAMTRVNRAFQTLRVNSEEFEGLHEQACLVAPGVLLRGESQPEDHYLRDEKPDESGERVRLRRAITLDGVHFGYSKKSKILVGISLSIPRGSFVSICGPSGGGKTTLLLIIMGLIRPTKGEVRCDDWNVQHHIRHWHRNIGYVSQDLYIATGTVRENVAFAVPSKRIDDALVWRALELASAADFVRNLPQGLDTELSGSRGLSGGQRQRIVIARALYLDPDVLVFDEATAALDNETEREITEAIHRLSRKKTIICVAHRLRTIRESDTIHYVEEGRILASGTYDELLRNSKEFRTMAEGKISRDQGVVGDADGLAPVSGG